MKCNKCGMPMNELRGSKSMICVNCNHIQESEDE